MNHEKIQIAILPGDGIGAEVTFAALPIFEQLNLPINLVLGDIGWEFWRREGTPIPQRTWDLIEQSDATLVGAVTSKPQREAYLERGGDSAVTYVSPIIQLRQRFALYANVRPCFSIKDKDQSQAFDFCVVRENTEGLYAGFDYYHVPESIYPLLQRHPNWCHRARDEISCTLRVQSREGLLKIFKFAFAYAHKQALPRVTLADKPNILRDSSAFAREIFETVALDYPNIQADILNIDGVALRLLKSPETFGVIVAENMFGDILADLGASVMGGLGLVPSMNMGDNKAYFEPAHGSGPCVAFNCANPSAMFLSIALLLDYIGYADAANQVRRAVVHVIQKQRCVTYDLGGNASTQAMAAAIIKACQ